MHANPQLTEPAWCRQQSSRPHVLASTCCPPRGATGGAGHNVGLLVSMPACVQAAADGAGAAQAAKQPPVGAGLRMLASWGRNG